jgi:organic radical activating enzyme
MRLELEKVGPDLDGISPTFCPVKWRHKSINFEQMAIKACCHNPMRRVPSLTTSGDLDHPEDNRIRRELLAGTKAKECAYCWKMEETGGFSDRRHWSGMPWMNTFAEDFKSYRSEASLSPTWLELNFSPACNLKCSYCNPGVSTAWRAEINKLGAYPTLPSHNDLNWFRKEGLIRDQFEKNENPALPGWLERSTAGLRLLTITGGEPLLSAKTITCLERFERHPNPDLEIAINSNCCLPQNVWDRFTKIVARLLDGGKVKRIYLHPSLDSWGERAEYIRFGMDLKLLQKNVGQYLTATAGDVVFNCTLNNLSLGGIADFWKYVVDLKRNYVADGSNGRILWANTEILIEPRWQRLELLPERFQDDLISLLMDMEKWRMDGIAITDQEIKGVRRALDLMARYSPEPARDRADKANFFRFFRAHDERRGTSFTNTFPELRPFWRECAAAARSSLNPLRFFKPLVFGQ